MAKLSNELINIEGGSKIKFYSYRTARVMNRFITMSRDSDIGKELENLLANMANVSTDNHTVYEITNREGSVLYVWCEDSEIMIGTEIIVERC